MARPSRKNALVRLGLALAQPLPQDPVAACGECRSQDVVDTLSMHHTPTCGGSLGEASLGGPSCSSALCRYRLRKIGAQIGEKNG